MKVFKNGPGKICGRQPSKNLKWYGLPKNVYPALEKSSLYIHSEYLKKQIHYSEY